MIQAWNIDGYCDIDEIKVIAKVWSSPFRKRTWVYMEEVIYKKNLNWLSRSQRAIGTMSCRINKEYPTIDFHFLTQGTRLSTSKED